MTILLSQYRNTGDKMFVWVTGFYCPVSRTGSPQNEDKKKKENEKKKKKKKEKKRGRKRT